MLAKLLFIYRSRKGEVSENNVKLIFHFTFAIVVLSVVTGIIYHYYHGRISSEQMEAFIYADIVERCLSESFDNRTFVGFIDKNKVSSFEDCFYVSDVDLYKNIVAINATLFVDNYTEFSVYFNKHKYDEWINLMHNPQFSRFIIKKNVVYNGHNAILIVDEIFP